MKIKLTSHWQDGTILHTCGSIVDVSEQDGAALKSAGHIEVDANTRSTRNGVYTVGCIVTPFNTEPSVTYAKTPVNVTISESKHASKK